MVPQVQRRVQSEELLLRKEIAPETLEAINNLRGSLKSAKRRTPAERQRDAEEYVASLKS